MLFILLGTGDSIVFYKLCIILNFFEEGSVESQEFSMEEFLSG